jgi:phenylalanyl-tRNA synthetase alpha chain
MNAAEVIALKEKALAEARDAASSREWEAVRVRYLGRKGALPDIMKGIKEADPAERSEIGKQANLFRQELSAALEEKASASDSGVGATAAMDTSLPGQWRPAGSRHPISTVIDDITAIFRSMGFTVADGPDIDSEYNNFDALNTPADHPSRDAHDTFYLDNGDLLRTQTSTVQIRVMESTPPPIRIIAPGRCYRRDTTDATHSANFHQVEGLYVDRKVSLADLKGDITYFAHRLMGPDVQVRFRPHFFPFTEPSVEYDFSCHVCRGSGCRVCKNSGWIEISGAGMVDPRVFQIVGYDPEEFTGYAFGMGVERIAMIKYGIQDIRHLYDNDVRFLSQFA